MQEVSVSLIEKAIYEMCYEANLFLPEDVYQKIEKSCICDKQNEFILKNAYLASENKRPLCQDTGQVVVFVTAGQDVRFINGNLENAINSGVSRCYKENYFRKSVVKNALFDRDNTCDNTPCAVHFNIVEGDEIDIKIMLKGGGSENVTGAKMLNPTLSKKQVYQEILDVVKKADRNACPPIFVGVGVGKTLENTVLLSKKAVLEGEEDEELCEFLNDNVEIGLKIPVLSAKILTNSTHIASMPLGVTILCHSNRYHSCKIKNNEIFYTTQMSKPKNIEVEFNAREIWGDNLALKGVQVGEKVLFSGKIYTARDLAHKKLTKMLQDGQKMPFDLQNSVIFYAGPCPNAPDEVCAPIGPTTAKRMDDFAIELYEQGVVATIAKGGRCERVCDYLKQSGKKYFEIQGGIASYLSRCVKSSRIVAFEEFGAEAIYELVVEKLPLTCVV